MSRITHVATLPDLLKEAGYTTMMIGKTHFGPVPDSRDHVLGEDYDQYLKAHGLAPFSKRQMPTPIPEEHFRDTYYAMQTISQIDQTLQNNDGPFFAFCSLPAPHPPETPPGDWTNA
jgi:arylsulfatase A-like enzyme